MLPDFTKEHRMKLCNKEDAPAEKHGTWQKVSTSIKKWRMLRFTRLMKPGQCWRSPEEREFVVDFVTFSRSARSTIVEIRRVFYAPPGVS